MQVNITMVKITIKDVKAYNLSCLFSILKDKRVKPLSLIRAIDYERNKNNRRNVRLIWV